MTTPLACTCYFDSRLHPPPGEGAGGRIDVAVEPAATADLERLGLAVPGDLPAVLCSDPGGKLRLLALRASPEEVAGLASGAGAAHREVAVYSTGRCADCRRAKRLLAESGMPHREVAVDEDPEAEALIRTRSGGRRVVPTLLFGGRLFAFNPAPELLRRLIGRPAPAAS